jgi:hypothetical protein
MTLGMLILVAPELTAGGAAAHVWLVFAGFILFNKNAIDILGDFGEACREEFRSLRVETA